MTELRPWEQAKIKSVARLVTERGRGTDWKIGLDDVEGWTGRVVSESDDLEGEGVAFRKGDVLFGKLRPYLAKAWVADRDGAAVGDFLVMRPQREIMPDFLVKTFLSPERVEEASASSFGAKMPRVSWGIVREMLVHLPPIDEQREVLRFLDRETAEIDAFIADQEELIRLLTERRAATITHAVTKGLDPSVELKDGGRAFIGAVPAHWTVMALRRLHPTVESGTSVNGYAYPASGDEPGVLKTGSASKGRFDANENKRVLEQEEGRLSTPARQGRLLLNRANTPDLVGSTAYIAESVSNLYLSDKLWQLDFPQDENRFIHYWTHTDVYRAQLQALVTGASSSMQNLSYGDFLSIAIAMPPRREQTSIVDRIERGISEFDAVLADARKAITLSRERRAALISDAVTGKIDVREHALSAP